MDYSDGDESNDDICPEIIEDKIIKLNGDEITKKYIRGKFLGKGGFAKCYEVKCRSNNKIFAAKVVNKSNIQSNSQQAKLKSEIKIHKSMNHPHIVKFEHVFEDNQNVYILLELCKNKTLSQMLKKRKILTELEVKYFVDQIVKVLKYMHKNKVIHRDLKLGNLFLAENMDIKIGDFGLATMIEFKGQLRYTVCGTPNYIAPEILEGRQKGHSYEVDIWALGVMIYTLIIGKPPYETEDVKETYNRIKENNYSFPSHIFISDVAKDLIKRILVINPSDRLTIDQIKNHAFLQEVPVPKTLTPSSLIHPPSNNYYNQYLQETGQITNVVDFDNINNNDRVITYHKKLIEFSKSNLKKIECEVYKHDFIYNKEDLNNRIKEVNLETKSIMAKCSINYKKKTDNTMNMKYLVNYNDLSMNKNFNPVMQKKKEKLDYNDYSIIENIVQDNIGIYYTTSKNILGILFNDRTYVYKLLNKDEYCYKDNNSTIVKSFKAKMLNSNSNNKENENYENILKCNALKDYEKMCIEKKYFDSNNSNSSSNNSKELLYVKKIIKTNMAFFFKLSNDNIQATFYDKTKFIIDTCNKNSILFFDDLGIFYQYDIHLVNKTKNKKLLKRYEYYKKVFGDKLEERFSKKQLNKERSLDLNNNNNNNLDLNNNESNVNLNLNSNQNNDFNDEDNNNDNDIEISNKQEERMKTEGNVTN